MKKKEIILREILNEVIKKRDAKITQMELAQRLGVSTSTVNNAVGPLVQLGAIDARRTGLVVIDFRKVLLYLASNRSLQRDIIYQTYIPLKVTEIEKSMPEGVIYTMFSAYRLKYEEVPADYSEVYIYADEELLQEIKRRFPEEKGPSNLFVLKSDPALYDLSKEGIAPLVQVYIDLWNTRQWYAKEFLTAIERKINIE
jgi:DNA-binding GntR family transcriptional regulator